MTAARPLRLTKALVTLCHREMPELCEPRKYDYYVEADYDRAVDHILAGRPPGPFWLFAYGSLIWKPEFPALEMRRATAKGWHRAFSMLIRSHRGTPEQPGYMMCLDHGGVCEGVVLKLNDSNIRAHLGLLVNREIGSDEALESVRWIDVETPEGPVRALVFYAAPHLLDYYHEAVPLPDVARVLARACGHWGSGAEYLYNTITHLEALGIQDDALWQLQDLVAAEIEALFGLKLTKVS